MTFSETAPTDAGNIIAKGKTKTVTPHPRPQAPRHVRLRNHDDTTAGDGARHEIIAGKAEISTRTTVNIFTLLQRCCGFPIAIDLDETRRSGDTTSFIALELEMLKLEVVTRGRAWGSWLERHLRAKKGDPFDTPVVEFFLKTSGSHWSSNRPGKPDHKLACDDPLMIIGCRTHAYEQLYPQVTDVWLHHAHEPFVPGKFFLRLDPEEAFPIRGTVEALPIIAATNRAVYEVLCYAWSAVGILEKLDIVMPDMKIEYGFNSDGALLIGDVIDAESCRLLVNGEHASKQGFREGASAETTKLQLARAADLSDLFEEVWDQVGEFASTRYRSLQSRFPVSW